MGLGDDADQLAAALSETTFDAVERDGLRAEWVGEGHQVVVRPLDGEKEIRYDAEDLVRAASDTEMRNARVPGASDEPE